jgi:hypothetical protein
MVLRMRQSYSESSLLRASAPKNQLVTGCSSFKLDLGSVDTMKAERT